MKFGLDMLGSPAKIADGTRCSSRLMKFWAAENVTRLVRTYTRLAESRPAKSATASTSGASSSLLPPLLCRTSMMRLRTEDPLEAALRVDANDRSGTPGASVTWLNWTYTASCSGIGTLQYGESDWRK